MIELEGQVCSLNLAKRLKELGVKQESCFDWVIDDDHPGGGTQSIFLWEHGTYSSDPHRRWISAFAVAELGEMLPRTIESKTIEEWEKVEEAREAVRDKLSCVFKDMDTYDDQFESGMPHNIRLSYNDGLEVSYHQITDEWECNYRVIEISGDTEADARAKMLIYLIENKLITV